MKQGYDYVVKATYDKPAYQALSEASWVLFRKHQLQTAAYPAMFSLAALVAIVWIFNWKNFDTVMRVVGIVFVAAQFLVIPLGAASAKHKMARTAIKKAVKEGEFPIQVQFVFQDKQVHATIGGEVSTVPYSAIDCLVSLGDWRLLFFGHAAYILHASSFESEGELKEFEKFVSGKCGLPFNQMKGKGPARR